MLKSDLAVLNVLDEIETELDRLDVQRFVLDLDFKRGEAQVAQLRQRLTKFKEDRKCLS